MTLPNKPEKKKPVGKAIKFTDEQLETLSTITPDDLLSIQQTIKNVSPLVWALLNAQRIE